MIFRKKYNLLRKTNFLEKILLYVVAIILTLSTISTSTVDTMYNSDSSLPLDGFSNRIRDYTAKIFNISTLNYVLPRNERKLFLSNVFPSSFIFYSDESSENLMDHNDIMQRHYIFKMPRNTNNTKAQIKHGQDKKQSHHNSDEPLVSEEDYFLEYEDQTTSKTENNKRSSGSSSCASCQHNLKAKKDSLESIKKHILMRLQLSQPPNITIPRPPVPQKILDEFYKNLNYSKSMDFQQSVYKHYYNKIDKRKSKGTQRKVGDAIRDGDDEESTRYEDDNDDIMISDNRYDYMDDDYPTSSIHSDEFYSRLHSIYVFPTSKYNTNTFRFIYLPP